MTTLLWILHGFLAFAFVAGGTMKLMKARTDLIPMGMDWAEDFTDSQVKTIGALELAGGIGVIAPVALGILPVVSGLAAVGLVLTMGGAAVTHIKRGELPFVGVNVLLGGIAAYVASTHFM